MRNSSTRSWNWPWISPQTVTGHLTGWTFHSSTRTSLACSQRVFTSSSGSGLHCIR
uniref:Serine/threonine-protein phosphatase n=1 Tax=Rhizophora mucronata TaxID=61149 RepID=A0A2P2IXH3_RHIMU